MKRAGARKVLFGTDGPWLHPAVEITKIYALNLNPEDQAAILGGNLMRLIGRRRPAAGPVASRQTPMAAIAASAA